MTGVTCALPPSIPPRAPLNSCSTGTHSTICLQSNGGIILHTSTICARCFLLLSPLSLHEFYCYSRLQSFPGVTGVQKINLAHGHAGNAQPEDVRPSCLLAIYISIMLLNYCFEFVRPHHVHHARQNQRQMFEVNAFFPYRC